jgi:hypothetical protein
MVIAFLLVYVTDAEGDLVLALLVVEPHVFQ